MDKDDRPNKPAEAGKLLRIFRMAALLAGVAGGAGSFVLMLLGGHPPIFLRVLFAIWVLSPFAGLLMACLTSKRWSPLTRRVLYSVTLLIAVGSLGLYGDRVMHRPETTPAFRFIVVPLVSWLLILIVLPIAALISGRPRRGA